MKIIELGEIYCAKLERLIHTEGEANALSEAAKQPHDNVNEAWDLLRKFYFEYLSTDEALRGLARAAQENGEKLDNDIGTIMEFMALAELKLRYCVNCIPAEGSEE